MKNIIFLIALSLLLSSCKVEMDTSRNVKEENPVPTVVVPEPKDTEKVAASSDTILEGQIFYNSQEVIDNREQDSFRGFEYKLYDFKVYALGRNSAYVAYADYEGNFVIHNVLPDSYRIIVKTKQYFYDNEGSVYTYMYTTTGYINQGDKFRIPIINPVRTYVDSNTGSSAINAIGEARQVTGIKAQAPKKNVLYDCNKMIADGVSLTAIDWAECGSLQTGLESVVQNPVEGTKTKTNKSTVVYDCDAMVKNGVELVAIDWAECGKELNTNTAPNENKIYDCDAMVENGVPLVAIDWAECSGIEVITYN